MLLSSLALSAMALQTSLSGPGCTTAGRLTLAPKSRLIRSLLIDNYDSYTHNLFHLLAEVNGIEPYVVFNDAFASYQQLLLAMADIDNIVISPGPGHPQKYSDFGICREVILESDLPILGVCLGHQGIAASFGGEVKQAEHPMHGRLSRISHTAQGIFASLPQDFEAVRYHSLVADRATLPACLLPTAWTADGQIMGLQHSTRPIFGVQFHPESISTQHGAALLDNFRRITSSMPRPARTSPATPPARAAREASSAAPLPRDPPAFLHVTREPLPPGASAERVFAHMYGNSSACFWLDSAAPSHPSERALSFMGAVEGDAHAVEYLGGGELHLRFGNGSVSSLRSNVFDYLRRSVEAAPPPSVELDACMGAEALPFNTSEAWFGYLGYEGRHDARAIGGSSADGRYDYGATGERAPGNLSQPVALLLLPRTYLVLDHASALVYVVSAGGSPEAARALACAARTGLQGLPATDDPHESAALGVQLTARKSEGDYRADIAECLRQIDAGETYEVCLTVQFRGAAPDADALALYRVLRRRNPAPYASYIRYAPLAGADGDATLRWLRPGGIAVMSSSPERYIRATHDGRIESRPIKGTARRDLSSPANDAAIAQHLQRDEKSRAENLMIVDLVRNDFGRVCSVGSVKVPRMMEVESYASVHQLVSTISGTLRPSMNAIDAIVATFPGGSMTGAPKLRTMDIIDSIEGRPRGIYSGAIGYISKNGVMDLSIVIRTAVLNGQELTVSAGGAIVAMSDPAHEIEEVLLKARAVASSIDCTIAFEDPL